MRIKIEKPGEFGLVTDPSPQEIPHNAWSAVQNVRFDLSAARNANGYAELDTPTDPATSGGSVAAGGSVASGAAVSWGVTSWRPWWHAGRTCECW